MLTAPVFVAGTVVGVRWGILGVPLGVTIAHAITSLPGVFVLLRRTPVRVRDILPVWLIPAAASAAGVVVLKVLPSLPSGGAGALFLRGVVFLGVYLLGWVLAPGGLPMLRAVRRSGTD